MDLKHCFKWNHISYINFKLFIKYVLHIYGQYYTTLTYFCFKILLSHKKLILDPTAQQGGKIHPNTQDRLGRKSRNLVSKFHDSAKIEIAFNEYNFNPFLHTFLFYNNRRESPGKLSKTCRGLYPDSGLRVIILTNHVPLTFNKTKLNQDFQSLPFQSQPQLQHLFSVRIKSLLHLFWLNMQPLRCTLSNPKTWRWKESLLV